MSPTLDESVYEILSSSPEPMSFKDLFGRVKRKCSDLCDDSIRPCPYCKENHPKWQHDVRWSLEHLKKRDLVTNTGRGYWQARPRRMFTRARRGKRREAEPPGRIHAVLKSKISDIGEAFGKLVHMEFPHPPYQYDVVWMGDERLPPTHVFEVQNKGSLEGALLKLKHAKDHWRCRLFLVVVDEKDRAKLELLLEPYWAGAFHEISKQTTVLTPDIIEQIHRVCEYREIVRKLVMGE